MKGEHNFDPLERIHSVLRAYVAERSFPRDPVRIVTECADSHGQPMVVTTTIAHMGRSA